MNNRSSVCFACGLAFILWLSSCANRVAPEGGPKDTSPPEVIFSSPPNYSTSFSGNRIRIDFNEFIQLRDPDKQIVISPLPDEKPEITARKKSLFINLSKALRPNTTTTFNFGNSITDVRESNVLSDFRFVVSSGSFIDSLSLQGVVLDALTLQPVKEASVMLFSDDNPSTPLHSPPDYISQSREDGRFSFSNLRTGSFRLFALKEKNVNFFYDHPDESLSFYDSLVPAGDSTVIKLLMFKPEPDKLRLISATAPEPVRILLSFNSDASHIQIHPAYPPLTWHSMSFNSGKDSLVIWLNDTSAGSFHVVLKDGDSVFDSVQISLRKPVSIKTMSSSRILPLKLNPEPVRPLPGSRLTLVASHPLASVESSKIRLYADSVLLNASFFISGKHSTVVESNTLCAADKKYRIKVLPEAIRDIYGRTHDTLELNIHPLTERETGSVFTQIENTSGKKILVLLVDDKEKTVRDTILGGLRPAIHFRYLAPGSYRLKAIADTNENGRWDTGRFPEKQKPEPVVYFNETITIRANWDIENEWKIEFK